MKTFLLVVAAVAVALHLYRQYWARRELPQRNRAAFDGEVYRVGETVIARRPAAAGSERTVICFPGFLEDMRYFLALYEGEDCELILINNAGYHCAFPLDRARTLHWPENPHPVGTIEHDGYLLGQVLRELAHGSEVTLHGHSRGGAVVLEAGRQCPELMRAWGRRVRALLEAPVLPGARLVGRGSDPVPSAMIRYLLPIALGLLRSARPERLLRQPMMRPTNALKSELCLSIYANPRRYGMCVTNVRNIRAWQARHDASLFGRFADVVVIMGERDDVLDNASMRASAERGRALNPGVRIVATAGTNHFVSLERPECVLELYHSAAAAA